MSTSRAAQCLFAALFLLSAASAGFAAEQADAGTRPNIVCIVIDDLGWADLGCYGSKLHRTPSLDALAAEGMRFTQAYAACPVCSPTRAALLTGKYPARLHLTDWLPGRRDRPDQKLLRPQIRQQLPLEEVTLAEALQSAGYVCGSIGKWHLGGSGFLPQDQGFATNIAGDEAGSPRSYFAPFERNGRSIPGLEQAPAGEYLTDRLTAEAEKFIERNRDQPFFLYLPHYTVHIPMAAPQDLVDKYPPAGEFRGAQNNPIYAAMLESLDSGIGKILKKLADLHLDERTIVVFTSDNGGLATTEGPHTPATSNAPLREGKGYLYEGGIRVPLLVRWPGTVKPASVSETPVCSIDLFPTLLEACGVQSDRRVDGVSLMPLLKQSGDIAREALYWHYPHYANQGGRPGGAIRSGEFKLIEFYENGRRELFNLRQDPRESKNLAGDMPDRVAELAQRLDQWRTAVQAQPMTPNPDYTPNPQSKDGTMTMHSRTAEVFGTMLRYEPMPHKSTLGFWVRADDWARFECTVKTPGEFRVEILQGCGNGSGGSTVEFRVGDQTLETTIQETGGFQNFVARDIGTVQLTQAGRLTIEVRAKTKPGVAVMDLRQIRLLPVK